MGGDSVAKVSLLPLKGEPRPGKISIQKTNFTNMIGLPRTGPIFRPIHIRPISLIRIRPVRKLIDSEFVPFYKEILLAYQLR